MAATTSGDAWSQPAEEAPAVADGGPSLSDKETARELFRTGNRKFAAGDYAAALADYEGADAIMGVPTTSYKVGLALAQLGRLLAARDALLRATRYPVQPDEPEPYRKARASAATLAAEVRERIPSLLVRVGGVPEDVTVRITVDGVALALKTAGLPRKVDPGQHAVRVSADGYQPDEQTITLEQRQQGIVKLTLIPEGAAGGTDDGSSYQVSPLVYIGFGVGLAGIVVGSIAGVVSLNAAADAKDQCYDDDTCPQAAQPDLDRAATFAPISTVSFILAGVGVGVGIAGLFMSGSDEPETDDPAAALSPLIGPGYLGVTGRF